jgi:hypothetical protein
MEDHFNTGVVSILYGSGWSDSKHSQVLWVVQKLGGELAAILAYLPLTARVQSEVALDPAAVNECGW